MPDPVAYPWEPLRYDISIANTIIWRSVSIMPASNAGINWNSLIQAAVLQGGLFF